ncbi:MAG: DUF3617 domain-containing protein [Novosphingobium sp.]
MASSRVRLSFVASTLLAVAAPAFGGGPSLAMLDQLDAGKWELHARDGQPQQVCIASGRRLIQLRHPEAQCNTFVIEDSPSQVVVQYTCPGRGYGRTEIRRETNRLIQLQSQGVVDGYPFEVSGEARRIGSCAPR